jgi:hypothetical protein
MLGILVTIEACLRQSAIFFNNRVVWAAVLLRTIVVLDDVDDVLHLGVLLLS